MPNGQFELNTAVDSLPAQPRMWIQDAANTTVLQFFRVYDWYNNGKIKALKDPSEKEKYKAELQRSLQENVEFVRNDQPLNEQKKATLDSILRTSNMYGGFLAQYSGYLGSAGLVWIFCGSMLYPGVVLTGSWCVLAPALINKQKFGVMLEDHYRKDLTWGYAMRDRLRRASSIGPGASTDPTTVQEAAPSSSCNMS